MLLSTLKNIQKNLRPPCYELYMGLDIEGCNMSSYKILEGNDWKRITILIKKTSNRDLIIILFVIYLDVFRVEKIGGINL
jgi:hypothetical protein